MKLRLIIFNLFLLNVVCYGQKTIFHEYYNTDSDIHIKEWNIDKNDLPNQFVKEIIDNKDRVIELKFFRNGSLNYSHLCYLSVWIKYEYPDDTTIVAYFLDSVGKENAEIECGMPSKTTYNLSKDKKIILKTTSEYNLDKNLYLKNGWTESELKKAIKDLESEKSKDIVVDYYDKCFSKLNKEYPVAVDFEIDRFLFSEKEKEEIEKCLNNE